MVGYQKEVFSVTYCKYEPPTRYIYYNHTHVDSHIMYKAIKSKCSKTNDVKVMSNGAKGITRVA